VIGQEGPLTDKRINRRGTLVEAFYNSRGAPFWFSTRVVCRRREIIRVLGAEPGGS